MLPFSYALRQNTAGLDVKRRQRHVACWELSLSFLFREEHFAMKHELSQLLLAMNFENNIRSITNDHLFRDIELIVIVYAVRGLAVSPRGGNRIRMKP